jgi:hypothetical protein
MTPPLARASEKVEMSDNFMLGGLPGGLMRGLSGGVLGGFREQIVSGQPKEEEEGEGGKGRPLYIFQERA